MKGELNRFEIYLNSNPRQSIQLLILVFVFVWQVPVAILGLIFYSSLTKKYQINALVTLGLGALLMGMVLFFNINFIGVNFINYGFVDNWLLFKAILSEQGLAGASNYIRNDSVYYLGFPMLVCGLLSVVNLIKDNPHLQVVTDLQNGTLPNIKKDLSEEAIQAALDKLDVTANGSTVLGVSKYTGNRVLIPDKYLNQIMLVLGTTGSGKTITLRQFYRRAIQMGYPLIVVDGKPTDENVAWLQAQTEKNGRTFDGFNGGNYSNYDALAYGGYTELKDKIISLKDEWDSDYYKSIAEDYLQTTFEVLIGSKKPFDLKVVADCLNLDDLVSIARDLKDINLLNRVTRLKDYDIKDIKGLQAHLHLLIYSEFGKYLTKSEKMFSLADVIADKSVVYFALPALRFPTFAKVLGKLVINDLKATIDRCNGDTPVFMIFDEFSVFAGEQVLNLVNMGRGKGVHAVFGTQGLADLNTVDPAFESQVLNCANTIICHRLNDHASAETVSEWIGTVKAFTVSAQYNPNQADLGIGTVAVTKEFVVHPDDIKQELRTGEAYWATKVGDGRWGKVRVKL